MQSKKRANKIFCVLFVLVSIASFFLFTGFASGYSTSAKSAIVLERNSGQVMFEKNADHRLPIASTTKILTAITVIENTEDLNKTVTVPDVAVGVEGSSIYLQKDEKLRIIDLLYGLMLQSGNDCAVALACLTSGSVENFALMMNATARIAGASNSHFVNPHGLHDDRHFSTARDLALITAYAMRNETFRKIVATEVYKDCPFEGRDYNRIIKNKNKILTTLEGGNGVKTGYTKEAGRCLVSSAERNGKEMICVVLSCGPMFEESGALIETAFAEVESKDNNAR